MLVTIYPAYPCLVRHGKSECYLKENEKLELGSSDKIFIYPTSKNSIIPFEVSLFEERPYYRLVKKEDRVLVFLLDGMLAENVSIYKFSHGGISSKVELYPKSVIFSNSTSKKIISLPFYPIESKASHFYHIDYLYINSKEEECLIAFNVKNGEAKTFRGRKIELSKSGFTIDGEEYSVDKEGLKKVSSLPSKILSSPETICATFMQQLSKCNFLEAKECLGENLKGQSEQDLRGYFGHISYFYMLSPSSAFAIADGKNKIFNFEVKDKIEDIDEE